MRVNFGHVAMCSLLLIGTAVLADVIRKDVEMWPAFEPCPVGCGGRINVCPDYSTKTFIEMRCDYCACWECAGVGWVLVPHETTEFYGVWRAYLAQKPLPGGWKPPYAGEGE